MKPKVFVVANSHIDPVWLWDKYEGIDEVLNTFKSACDRLDEYPELRFSASSICFYKWVEEYAPEVFERIKAHVASGRWEIVGGWWVETDCNLPLAQSFRKSAERSRNFTQSRFGIDTPVAFSPDSFGHAAPLPAILADSGFEYYVFQRPNETEKPDLPGDLFYWEHGGKRVLTYRLRFSYSQGFNFDEQKVNEMISDPEFLADGVASLLFGMGDHGGGPTKLEIEALRRIIATRNDLDAKFATCLDFFKEVEKLPNIPTYSGDLHRHAVGSYSVNRALKDAIRQSERSLVYAQRTIDCAGKTSEISLDPLWEKVIFNQFHDIMPGSSSPDATGQAMNELGGVRDSCGLVSHKMLRGIASKAPARSPQGEFRIFNSLPRPVTAPLEIESFLYFREGAPFMDSTGKVIEIQDVTPSVLCLNHRWLFVDTIPALSEKSYFFESEAPLVRRKFENLYFEAGSGVSLGQYRLESPGQIVDASSGNALLKSPIALSVTADSSDTWSHGLHGYGSECTYFRQEMSSVCEGSVASFLLVRQAFGHSTAELRYTVYRDLPFVDLSIKVHWSEAQSILKLEIEPVVDFESFEVQGPGASITKTTDGIEEPLHGWIKASDLIILQDGAFAMDRIGAKIRINLVRSSIYGYDKRWAIDRLGPICHTDQGEHTFRLRFIRAGDLGTAGIDASFAEFIEPYRVVRSNT